MVNYENNISQMITVINIYFVFLIFMLFMRLSIDKRGETLENTASFAEYL